MRLFVAAELPEEEKRSLENLCRRRDWFGFGEGWRAVATKNLHLTLKFLGEVKDDRAAHVAEALKSVPWPPSLTLNTEGVTFFPPRGPINVFVAKLGGADKDRLQQLHADIEFAMEPLGFPPEARPFSPHVTLLRAERRDSGRRPRGVSRQLVEKNPPPPGQPFLVNSFVLFQSHLKQGGPEYVALARYGG